MTAAPGPLRLDAALRRRLARSALPPAVVVGTDVTGLAEARALARHGVPVIGVDVRLRRYTSYSSAFAGVLLCPDFYGGGVVEFLEQLAGALPTRGALFLSMDEHVKRVAETGERLRALYHFEFPTPGDVDLLMSKQRFAALARERGWPIPRTFECETMEQLEGAAAGCRFPVILKPQVKTLAFRQHSPDKAFQCDTPDELRRVYAMVAQWEKEVVVQEWIPGGDDEVYFSLHYFDASLRELAAFEGRKLRQYVPRHGSTCLAQGVARARVTELSREILRAGGCAGFGSVEYKRDPRTDEFFIIEPTVGRVDLQVDVAIGNNVDLVSRAYFHLAGRPAPAEPPPTHARKWIYLRSDYRSARYYMRAGELTWAGYLRSIRGPKVYAVWRRGELRMARAMVRHLASGALRVAIRRLLGRSAPPPPPAAPLPASGDPAMM